MMARLPLRPGSLVLLAFLLLSAVFVSALWVTLVLPQQHALRRGCDEVHHLVMISLQAEPASVPKPHTGFETYPQCYHWLVARFMPLLDGDAVDAMRLANLAILLILWSLQFTLWARLLPTRWAVLALLLWQWFCFETKTANLNFYYGTNFYSQALGHVGFWLTLVLTTTVSRGRWQQVLLMTLSALAAAFAYGCHIVPGVVAFGFLGLYHTYECVYHRRLAHVFHLLFAIFVGCCAVLGTGQWAHMSAVRGATGSLPLRSYWLLLLWVPTAAVCVFLLLRPSRLRRLANVQRRVLEAVALALVVAGTIQAYLAVNWYVRGTVGDYAVKKLFYYTFPLASLLWLFSCWQLAARRREEHKAMCTMGHHRRRLAAILYAGLIGLCLTQNFKEQLINELKGPFIPRERCLASVIARLRSRPLSEKCCYFDDQLPDLSIVASVVALRQSLYIAEATCWGLSELSEIELDLATVTPHVSTILLPGSHMGLSVAGQRFPAERFGSFRRAPFAPMQTAQHCGREARQN